MYTEQTHLTSHNKLAQLTSDVGNALIRLRPLRENLQECAAAIVEHMNVAFAGIWTLDPATRILQLEADAPSGRVQVGTVKITQIAKAAAPYLTNAIDADPLLADQEWARREGMRSFAGYPLKVNDSVIGVLAIFSSHTLSDGDLQALATVANVVALGTERKWSDDRLRARAEALSRSADQLARTNRELDAFAYAASHDLRAPLRGIANLAQWIEEDLTASGALPAQTREMLELLRTRMHRMESLIEGILQYSRAGRTNERVERVDSHKLLESVLDLLGLAGHGIVEIEGTLPVIESAQLPLQQVFMNLIGNAIKYNESAAPKVVVSARDVGRFVEFSVSDNGPGIAPEYHSRIWGVFQTLQARDSVEGTGIGLSLVRKLVDGQGGRAWVESALGEGATFRFLWPRRPETNTGIEGLSD